MKTSSHIAIRQSSRANPLPSTGGKPLRNRSKVPSPRKKAAAHGTSAGKLRRHPRKADRPSFGDLCEMSEGLAVVWRRNGCTEREMFEFMDDEPFILCDVIPVMHKLGFTEEDVIKYVPHDGILARLTMQFAWFFTYPGRYHPSNIAVPPWILASFLRRALTRRIAALKNKESRPVHYEAEKARRQAMAKERRRITHRTTMSPCPSAEALLDAWRHVRDSKVSLVRFGSMMQDLECYVDNSLRFDGLGRIVGRNAGIKGWLLENVPEMAAHYTSVIRYKAAAKKLRQIVGLADPTPVTTVLGTDGRNAAKASGGGEDSCNYGADKLNGDSPPVEVVRARAIYLEVMDGIPDVAARVMARIDALCDPERTDDAATLRSWREKYADAITVRRKDVWWRRLTA